MIGIIVAGFVMSTITISIYIYVKLQKQRYIKWRLFLDTGWFLYHVTFEFFITIYGKNSFDYMNVEAISGLIF